MVHLQEIGAALDAVRAAKKPVLAHAMLYADDAVLLAAHASEVWVDPLGGAFVARAGRQPALLRRAARTLKVNAHVFRVGTYKSAVEPYLRNDLSPEAREAGAALYGALWEAWKADVAKARPKAEHRAGHQRSGRLAQGIGRRRCARPRWLPGWSTSIGDRVQFGKRVAELAGKDSRDKRPGASPTPRSARLARGQSAPRRRARRSAW